MGSVSSSGEVNRADEMSQQEFEALGAKLRRSIEELNSEDFDRNYQTLTRQIQKPELDFDLTGRAVRNALLSMNKMIKHLRTIYNTVNQIQQMKEKVSDQNNEILRTVKSVNMKRIDETLKVYEKLKGSIDTLLINIEDYKITGQTKTKAGEIKSETLKLSPQMKEISSQIQKTLK